MRACTNAFGRYALSAYRLREHVDHLLDLSFSRIGAVVGSVRQLPVCVSNTPRCCSAAHGREPPTRDRGVGRSTARPRVEGCEDEEAIGSCCWSATRRITAVPVFKRIPKGQAMMRARSITCGFWCAGDRRRIRGASAFGRTGPCRALWQLDVFASLRGATEQSASLLDCFLLAMTMDVATFRGMRTPMPASGTWSLQDTGADVLVEQVMPTTPGDLRAPHQVVLASLVV